METQDPSKTLTPDLHYQLIIISVREVISYPFLEQWFGFEWFVQIWDLGPDLRVGSLDLSQLGFPVDYFSSACLLCLWKPTVRKFRIWHSQKEVWSIPKYKTLLIMLASAVCSLSPPAAPAHWPSTFFLLFWFSITFLSPFALFLICCDTVPSAWASLSLPSSPHSLSFAQTQATHPLNTWCIATYSLALLVLPPGVFLWWHQSGFDYVLPWVPLVPLSWH